MAEPASAVIRSIISNRFADGRSYSAASRRAQHLTDELLAELAEFLEDCDELCSPGAEWGNEREEAREVGWERGVEAVVKLLRGSIR